MTCSLNLLPWVGVYRAHSYGVRLEKREERGLVSIGTLRRWGIPIQTPRNSPVNAQNPGHDGGAGLQPELRFRLRHSNQRRAMLRRCSLFDISGRSRAARCIGVG